MLRLALILSLASVVACDDGAQRAPQVEVDRTIAPLDLNRATVRELERLPGIGDNLARSIIASRNARGGRFASVDQLLEIDGIGEKTLARVRPYLYVAP